MLKNALRWVNKFCTCPVMKMTHATRSLHSDTLFEQFNDAIASHSLDRALLIASQAVAEATEQMQCILVNAQARAALHSTSAFLTHVAARRQSQSTDLKIFLAELTGRITDASKAPGASSGAATAAWIDFLTGWLSKVDTDLVEPESILQASQSSPLLRRRPRPVLPIPRVARRGASDRSRFLPELPGDKGLQAALAAQAAGEEETSAVPAAHRP
jgi:hypothetical protein